MGSYHRVVLKALLRGIIFSGSSIVLGERREESVEGGRRRFQDLGLGYRV